MPRVLGLNKLDGFKLGKIWWEVVKVFFKSLTYISEIVDLFVCGWQILLTNYINHDMSFSLNSIYLGIKLNFLRERVEFWFMKSVLVFANVISKSIVIQYTTLDNVYCLMYSISLYLVSKYLYNNPNKSY